MKEIEILTPQKAKERWFNDYIKKAKNTEEEYGMKHYLVF